MVALYSGQVFIGRGRPHLCWHWADIFFICECGL